MVRLYSDDGAASSATRYSTATLAIPQTGGTVPLQAEFLPSPTSATSGGGVNLESVGAIELEIMEDPYDRRRNCRNSRPDRHHSGLCESQVGGSEFVTNGQ